MKVLVVGAGAVGLTFGSALARSTAVTLAVRPSRRDALGPDAGFCVASQATGWRGVRMRAEVAGTDALTGTFDVLWLAVDSTALDDALLATLRERVALDGIVVCVQPGAGDWAHVQRAFAGRRMVRGRIGFQAWLTPTDGLPGEAQGAAWFAFPLGASVFGGDPSATAWVVDTLRRGGLGARATRDGTVPSTEAASAVLVPLVAGLELSGWRFGALARSGLLPALRRMTRTRLRTLKVLLSALVAAAVFNAVTLRAVSAVRRVLPLNLERFLEVHFTKVGAQTLQQLDAWADTEAASAARALRAALEETRADYSISRAAKTPPEPVTS